MNVRDFVSEHFHHFNAGELTRCGNSLKEFLDGRREADSHPSWGDVNGSNRKESRTRNQVTKDSCHLLYWS